VTLEDKINCPKRKDSENPVGKLINRACEDDCAIKTVPIEYYPTTRNRNPGPGIATQHDLDIFMSKKIFENLRITEFGMNWNRSL
jgi:hypothetical protein